MPSLVEIDLLLDEIKNAARALVSNSLRRAVTVHLPPAGEVLITGDLHADVPAFDRVVEIADLRANPSRHLVLQELIHGDDSASNGCGSCVLVEKAAALVNRFPERVHVLMGNHEMAELTGRVIMKDSVVLNELFKNSLASRYHGRAGEVFPFFCSFWRSMPIALRTANRVFISHSTPSKRFLQGFDPKVLDRPLEPADLERGGSAYALIWGRDFSEDTKNALSTLLDADFFVVGHTPCEEGFAAPNGAHIILDSRGPNAKYLLLPLQAPLTYDKILGRILPLWP